MDFYLGGYYLVKPKPISFGSQAREIVLTASECINDHLISYWAHPWVKPARKNSADAEKTFSLDKPRVDAIREWVGAMVESDLIGWPNVFIDRRTAIEYRETFFSHVKDVLLLAIYFCEGEKAELIDEFKPVSKSFGEIGIYQMLRKESLETDYNGESLLGFDLIGVESGGDFHSFHCHDMADDLCKKFGLILNQFGLFNEVSDWQPILDHMNDEGTGCEPVPWFVTKVKLGNSDDRGI